MLNLDDCLALSKPLSSVNFSTQPFDILKVEQYKELYSVKVFETTNHIK